MQFSLYGTDESHKGLNPENVEGECTYWLEIATWRGRCLLAHCLYAESMISSYKRQPFFPSLVLKALS
jgi:hypothetical protein